ncbi:MAG TPA: amidohydrolase family protein [Streptosporangiaceae bacterium]|nr:amidohydrolase family protein [Streptosporangiaceae bacterium]
MSRYLVQGDPVVALGARTLIPDGALIVEGPQITDAGPREVLAARGPFDRVLGSAGHFVMPGFVNCHYHSELAIGPGLYQHIFEKANVHIQGAVGPVAEEDLYYGILWGLVTAIKGGQTGTVDMYYGRTGMEHFGCVPALRAYADAGLRTMFGLVSRDQNIYAHEPDEAFLARLPAGLAAEVRASPMGYAWPVDEVMATFETLSAGWHGRGDRISIATAPDWTPACSDELYRRCARAAREHDTSLLTHALETRSEMMFSLERYGRPAVRRLAGLGVLGPRTVLEHFVWVTDDEIGPFADSGAVASCDPGSNLRLASGICRVRDIMAAGGRIGFGTDGISFSDREDFFAELRLASYLQRLPRSFGEGRLDSEALLRAAAGNGARAIGAQARLGSLEPGKWADLLVVRKDRILFPPGRYDAEPFLDVVVDRADATDIDTVIGHGRVLMEGGRVTVVDEDQVRERFAAAVRERVYRPPAEVRRWIELGTLVEPRLAPLYQRWYDVPVEPAHAYNARRVADGADGPGPGGPRARA